MWIPCQASSSVLCLHYRPETLDCSTKDAYTSELTFLGQDRFHELGLLRFQALKPRFKSFFVNIEFSR